MFFYESKCNDCNLVFEHTSPVSSDQSAKCVICDSYNTVVINKRPFSSEGETIEEEVEKGDFF